MTERDQNAVLFAALTLAVFVVVLGFCVPAARGPQPNESDETPRSSTRRNYIVSEHIGCRTREDLNELTNASIDENRAAMRALVASGRCSVLLTGTAISLIDTDWGAVKIRLLDSGRVVWTYREAIHEERE